MSLCSINNQFDFLLSGRRHHQTSSLSIPLPTPKQFFFFPFKILVFSLERCYIYTAPVLNGENTTNTNALLRVSGGSVAGQWQVSGGLELVAGSVGDLKYMWFIYCWPMCSFVL